MMVYKRNQSQPFKWLLAIIVFMLAMSVTFSDVYGIQVNSGSNSAADRSGTEPNLSIGSDKPEAGNEGLAPQLPSEATYPVPEPAVLLLLAGGLTAIYTARRLRKRAD